MNPQMFREYDIRGIAGKDMAENRLRKIRNLVEETLNKLRS